MAMSTGHASDIIAFLTENITDELPIIVENRFQSQWGKSLVGFPHFTIKEIENYRIRTGKGNAIIKTRDRGRKFMDERYLSSDEIFTLITKSTIQVKGKCKASMKKDMRTMSVTVDKLSGKVIKGHCNCPAGQSGYCNHVMALLFELANYSLRQLKTIPEESACTSKQREWGVPSYKKKYALPVMSTNIHGNTNKKGVSSTPFDPRLNENKIEHKQIARIKILQDELHKKDNKIGFAHVVDMQEKTYESTKYGSFMVGSPLPNQLAIFDAGFEIISSISNNTTCETQTHLQDVDLPLETIPINSDYFPKTWGVLNYCEIMLLEEILPENITNDVLISYYWNQVDCGSSKTR